ncbi:SEC61G [Symbiodinium sp. CCMP2456]|nr:SEC61G [Symbiodinium sp. CCMP2456]
MPFLTDKNNPVGYCVQGAIEFGMDSRRLIQRCTKPDAKEFKKIAVACAIGFSIMGFIGHGLGWTARNKRKLSYLLHTRMTQFALFGHF